MKNYVKDHIDRCFECYGQPLESNFGETLSREAYEQMRADLMIAVGMIAALLPASETAHVRTDRGL